MYTRTKIVATLGPSSFAEEKIRALIEAGVDVFRINFSHGTPEQRDEALTNVRQIGSELGHPVAVCGDLCGPKIRVGMLDEGAVFLDPGREIVIQRSPIEGAVERISTTFEELVDYVSVGDRVFLADGRLRLEVIRTAPPDEFTCRVAVGGKLSNGKGVNLPDTHIPTSPLTEKDRRDVEWIAQRDFDYVALSFVQRAEDIHELRGLLDDAGSDVHIIAKIEKPQALQRVDEIIKAADAVMVARGDLGVEMDFPAVPVAQKSIAAKCQLASKPCIIATEMLESMIQSPTPTRAEVSDVANAVFDHTDAVMLSGESAIGSYPVETVHMMNETLKAAQDYLEEHGRPVRIEVRDRLTVAALAGAIRQVAKVQQVAAVAVFTASGTTARLISKNRPPCPVLALASDEHIVRRCCLYFGVVPRLIECPSDSRELIGVAGAMCKELGLAKSGDNIIVVAGHPIGSPDRTNGLIIEQVP